MNLKKEIKQNVPTRIISWHSSTPKVTEANSIIDKVDNEGIVKSRRFYRADGYKVKDIHIDNHGNPKTHNFGNNGEHANDYEWENKKLKNKTTRNITFKERKENKDIL